MLAYAYRKVINMLINEVSKITGLTKKAIQYYIERELISPSILENGLKRKTNLYEWIRRKNH